MNIVVIGGGSPGKFGNDFCNRARSEGHDVYVISHRDYGTNDPKQIVADFNNVDEFLVKFKNLTTHLDKIDVLLYNTNGYSYPGIPEQLQSTSSVSFEQWEQSLKLHVVIPHSLALESLKKMTKGCSIVFMTSGMSYDLKRTTWTDKVGYAGFKGMQNHLMIGLAYHNDKEAIVTCIAPYFPYEDKEKYSNVLNNTYEYITTLTEESNGKIRGIFPDVPLQYIN